MAIKAENLKIAYGEKTIIEDISLHIPEGSFCSVVGPNGCGKSTLLKALARTIPLKSGEIQVQGTPIGKIQTKKLSRKLAFLAQTPHVPEQFSVRDLVSYGRYPHTGWMGTLGSGDQRIIQWAMEQTGVGEFCDRELIHISGGERQRVWIAMALAQEAEILLMDEPTTYLDISHQFQTLELIRKLQRDMNRTVLMVLHDLNQAARYSDYIFVMKEGSLVARGTPEEIINDSLLLDVFSLETRIIRDEDNQCPYFLPVRGVVHNR